MLALAHAGLTLGVAAAAATVMERRTEVASSWVTNVAKYVDVRLLVVGSLLPDIIDKPVGQWLFRETFSDGRILSHTLLFLVLLSLAGYYLYRRRGKKWLLILAFGTFTHLIFDEMWLTPRTLFWPLLGIDFDRTDLTDWVSNIFQALFTNPGTYIPELAGGLIIAWFGLTVLRRRRVLTFIRRGWVA